MDAPDRLAGQLAKLYDRIRNAESEIDQLYNEVAACKPSQSSNIFGRAFSICKDTAAAGIQKAAIGKFNWTLKSLHSDIESNAEESKHINQFQKSLLSLEVSRLQNKVQFIWRIITTGSEIEVAEDTLPFTYNQLSRNAIGPDQLLGPDGAAAFLEQAFKQYARMLLNDFVKGEKPNISFTESYLPSLLKCYRDVQLVNELSESQKMDIRQMIIDGITSYFLEKKRREKPESSNVSNLFSAGLDALFYCMFHTLSAEEEKFAKNFFCEWANKRYPEPNLLEKSFKKYVLEDKKSLTKEFDEFFPKEPSAP